MHVRSGICIIVVSVSFNILVLLVSHCNTQLTNFSITLTFSWNLRLHRDNHNGLCWCFNSRIIFVYQNRKKIVFSELKVLGMLQTIFVCTVSVKKEVDESLDTWIDKQQIPQCKLSYKKTNEDGSSISVEINNGMVCYLSSLRSTCCGSGIIPQLIITII